MTPIERVRRCIAELQKALKPRPALDVEVKILRALSEANFALAALETAEARAAKTRKP